ncbi:2,3-bisphosphoglycerate-independent phosphoglycerate mutase [Pontibaca salina]|uniref:2,3-bisphosphoglycerate-independent phosphoglycerate mutase n=1 Tax=Pontibaca salina TaxID=2795731 RepID=A0A934LZV5_9RHOB|nr:2,3-bisphosphoglycerate-independent phosphoglycerate mutase [Pontibaca salina]MBI6629380.1 2,3-bisphosphoglycerate-independent phosphoglycerate mutase [Pontibaca salina]
MKVPKPVVLCILDGWGLSEPGDANAPYLANTPNFDTITERGPAAQLITHGPDVGLPVGQMGNSEVGHTNIGAGRVVTMDLCRIDFAIEDRSFFENTALLDFIDQLKASGGTAHLMGLMSDGGVHGHLNHIAAAAKAIASAGVPAVVHAITDGRDVAPKSALTYLEQLSALLPENVPIATVLGRYYAMDRDNRWVRVALAFDAVIRGRGIAAETAQQAIDSAYARRETDEFISPAVIDHYAGVTDGDGIFCLNFRADRAREILAAFGQPDFSAFNTGRRPNLAALMGMVDYSEQHLSYMTTLYHKEKVVNALGPWVAAHGRRQFRLAETEKYPHVTFFLNCGAEQPETGEDRFMPKSPKVATYDQKPEMSAEEVTDRFVHAIGAGYDLIVTNYANPDMVGHTGDLNAAIKACEAVDQGLGRVIAALEKAGGAMIVTADHGNCEVMVDPETGGPHTSHTLNPVPVVLVGGPEGARLRNGRLADLAPTLLELMGLPIPPEMTGQSLIE